MLKRINSILLLSGFIILLTGCSPARIPADYRYSPVGLKKDITGNWTEVKLHSKDITIPEISLSGELIAIQSDTLYLLTSLQLENIPVHNINEAVLYIYMEKSGKYATITGLGYLPDIVAAIGYNMPSFFLIGIPWVLTGTVITIVEGSDHSSLLNYPNKNKLQDLNKFARFPQGMPPGIEKARLHLIKTR